MQKNTGELVQKSIYSYFKTQKHESSQHEIKTQDKGNVKRKNSRHKTRTKAKNKVVLTNNTPTTSCIERKSNIKTEKHDTDVIKTIIVDNNDFKDILKVENENSKEELELSYDQENRNLNGNFSQLKTPLTSNNKRKVKEENVCSEHSEKLINITYETIKSASANAKRVLFPEPIQEHAIIALNEGETSATNNANEIIPARINQSPPKKFKFKKRNPIIDSKVESQKKQNDSLNITLEETISSFGNTKRVLFPLLSKEITEGNSTLLYHEANDKVNEENRPRLDQSPSKKFKFKKQTTTSIVDSDIESQKKQNDSLNITLEETNSSFGNTKRVLFPLSSKEITEDNSTLLYHKANDNVNEENRPRLDQSPSKKFKFKKQTTTSIVDSDIESPKQKLNKLNLNKIFLAEESDSLKSENSAKKYLREYLNICYPLCDNENDDDDLVDLSAYGLNSEELNNYSPSFLENSNLSCNLRTDNSTIENVATPSTSKQNYTIKLRDISELLSSQANKTKEEHDLDATIICEADENFLTSYNEEQISMITLTKIEPKENTSENIFLESDILEERPSYIRNMFNIMWREINQTPNLLSLLSTDDKCELKNLFNLPTDSQEVIMRLFVRLPKWYQIKKFATDIQLAISDTALYKMLDSLESLGFINQDYERTENLETLLNLLLSSDIKQIIKSLRLKFYPSKKPDMINAILNHSVKQTTLGPKNMAAIIREKIVEKLGKCIKLNLNFWSTLFRLRLLYYFPLFDILTHSDLYLFMENLETGAIILPKFQIRSYKVFDDCHAFNRYANARKLHLDYLTAKEKKSKTKLENMLEIASAAFDELQECNDNENIYYGTKFTPSYVYIKILTLAIVDLTKNNIFVQKWLKFLIENYQNSSYLGMWYTQLGMHQEKYDKNKPEALKTIQNGLANDKVSTIDKINLSQRANLLERKVSGLSNTDTKIPDMSKIKTTIIDAKPTESRQKFGFRKLYVENNVLYNVEEMALKHYSSNGYPKGVHCEGSLLMTLFAALFWDIIYCDVKGMFISRLQSVPLDFYSKDFYLRRKEKIDKRLEEIEEEWDDDTILEQIEKWKHSHGKEKSIHDIKLFQNSRILEESIFCIGRIPLVKLLKRLIKDVKQYQAGMPDLFVWNFQEKKCLFAEVKSHNDVLSMKQKVWLEFMQNIGIDVEICYINSIGQRASKARSRN